MDNKSDVLKKVKELVNKEEESDPFAIGSKRMEIESMRKVYFW